mmetsp:Transcript_58226/g.118550  ORF Transcript_58226/g.118550 Transcript_58226/m.118550 type:complete len:421 (-) Transcript_58226:639-1901(-)
MSLQRHQFIQLGAQSILGLTCLHQRRLGSALLLFLGGPLLQLGLDGCGGRLGKGLIVLLGRRLRVGGLCFHGFGVSDEFLKHAEDTEAGLLFVVLELGLTIVALGLNEGSLILFDIELLQRSHGFLQQQLSLTLLRDHRLELLVFFLSILASQLCLLVHFRHLILQRLNLGHQLRGLALDRLQLGHLLLLREALLLSLQFGLLQLRDTPILLFDLCRLLLFEVSLHFINGLLDTLEGVQLHAHSQCGQGARVQFLSTGSQHSCSTCLAAVLRRHLQEGAAKGFAEVLACLVGSQHLNGLADCSLLLPAQLASLLVIGVHGRTFRLDLFTHSTVCFQGCGRIFHVLLALRLLQVCCGFLLFFGLQLLLVSLELLSFGLHQAFMRLLVLAFLLFQVRQLPLEAVLETSEHSSNSINGTGRLL